MGALPLFELFDTTLATTPRGDAFKPKIHTLLLIDSAPEYAGRLGAVLWLRKRIRYTAGRACDTLLVKYVIQYL